MKKWLKIWLIIWWCFLITWWAWAGLTKAWIIPNWFDIEVLCPWKSYINYQWENSWWNNMNQKKYYKQSDDSFYEDIYNETNPKENIVKEKEINWFNIMPELQDSEVEEINRAIESISTNSSTTLKRYKPIIYLYPTVETEINVRLWTPETLSHTYPKYNSEKWWNVIAQPNWDLEDMDTWRKLYALYREWKSDKETNFYEWFVVAWKDIIPFLEEKLAILWLNEREAEEFIVYWLPQMENNKYNVIRFETIEEQNKNMPLNIIPAPDTVIRVMMDWKAIDEPIDIPEQQLTAPERSWFTVVEWWGSPRN